MVTPLGQRRPRNDPASATLNSSGWRSWAGAALVVGCGVESPVLTSFLERRHMVVVTLSGSCFFRGATVDAAAAAAATAAPHSAHEVAGHGKQVVHGED